MEKTILLLGLAIVVAIGVAPMEYVGVVGVALRATIIIPLYWFGVIDGATVEALVIY